MISVVVCGMQLLIHLINWNGIGVKLDKCSVILFKGAFTLTLSEHPCQSPYARPWQNCVYTTSENRIRSHPSPRPFWTKFGSDHVNWRLWASFDVLFDLRLNQLLSKQWRRWWFETPSSPLWRHSNVIAGLWQHSTAFVIITAALCDVMWYMLWYCDLNPETTFVSFFFSNFKLFLFLMFFIIDEIFWHEIGPIQ